MRINNSLETVYTTRYTYYSVCVIYYYLTPKQKHYSDRQSYIKRVYLLIYIATNSLRLSGDFNLIYFLYNFSDPILLILFIFVLDVFPTRISARK